MILNHLDLYVPDVAATRDFFVGHFGLRHERTLGADTMTILRDEAGLELVLSTPVAKRGGADQLALGVTTYHLGFHLASTAEVDAVFDHLRADGHGEPSQPRRMRGRYLFYCVAPGNVVVEVGAALSPDP
jgi:catechol 2,3-dioxygenase-like lactoylglutathione lyase family enzyme